jgi:PAS domain S-box-containing protein
VSDSRQSGRGDEAYRLLFEHAAARFRSFFESAPIGEAIVATDGRFLEVNDSLCELVGYPRDELVGKSFGEITHPDDLDADLEFVRQMLADEIRTYQMEKRYLHRLGHVVWTLLSVSLVREADGTPSYFISQIQDITERRAAAERLRRAEVRYRTLVEQLPLGVYVRPLDMSRPNIYCSPQVEPMLGYSAEDWQSDPGLLTRIVHPDDREAVLADAARVRETGEPTRREYRCIARDGRVVWVEDETHREVGADGEQVVQGFLQDISERKQAEEERDRLRHRLEETQRLEAVGRLAGGIAHDFNNMLTAIKGYSELLVEELPHSTRAHHEASQIMRAAEQAASLPAQLLAFSRGQALEPQLVDLRTVVAGTTELLRRVISEAIDLVVVPTRQPAFARVDLGQVQQVLINLALNAGDAMPAGGTLTVTTETASIGAGVAAEHQVSPGAYVVISVADDGEGMDAETRARAFEPFFTTKPQGGGSGLGLASVYGTVSQSGGFVRLESEPGSGTVVHVHFPAAAAPLAANEPPLDEAPPQLPLILVVEDEQLVRDFATRVLERAGFEVHTAANGVDALSLLERVGRPIDVLLADMVMPGMGGRELAERVLAQRPEATVVFTSGYTEETPSLGAVGSARSGFLQKPFSSAALVAAVSEAAERVRPTEGTVTAARDPITCVVADDHPAVLDAVSRYLVRAGFSVVARVSRADEALLEIEARRPTVALVDIRMEPFNGIEIVRRAAITAPETGIVLYTGHHDHELLRQALDAGARGFVRKDTPLSELAQGLAAVAQGGTHVDQELAAVLAAAATTAPLPALTKRERQVLALVSDGKTNHDVGAELGISAETVQTHVRNAMTKLSADTRTQAVATAMRQSLIA